MYHLAAAILRPYPLLCLALILALVNLWRRRSESRRRLLLLTLPVVGLVLISLPLASYLTLGSLEWQYRPLAKRPTDVAALVVLSGGVQRSEDGEVIHLHPDSFYRCLHAAQLYHQGEPCLVFVAGGKVDPEEPGPSLASALGDFLRTLDVAAVDLRLEEQSRDTYENALYTAELLKAAGITRVVLVTDAAHLPRAVRCFERQGIDVIPSGCSYRASRFEWADVREWIPSPASVGGVHSAFHEWVGIGVYWWRGSI